MTVENFKGISDPVRIEFKPITLLFGPNSSGKSTVIQALHYAHEIFERENVDPDETLIGGKSVNLGGFKNLVNNHDLSKSIAIRFELDLEERDLPDYPKELWGELTSIKGFKLKYHFGAELLSLIHSAWVRLTIKWSEKLDRPVLSDYEIGINDEAIAKLTTFETGRQAFLSYINKTHSIMKNIGGKDEDEIDNMTDKFAILFMALHGDYLEIQKKYFVLGNQYSALPKWERPLEFEGFREFWDDAWDYNEEEERFRPKEQFLGFLSKLIVGPGEMVRDALRKFIYLGPLRDIPSRNYEPVLSPNASRWASGMAAWDILHKSDDKFIEKVNSWLEDRLDSGYRVETKRYKELETNSLLMLALAQDRALDQIDMIKEEVEKLTVKTRVFLKEIPSLIEVMPQDVGIGISQVLPVIVLALHSKDGIIAIEQPEIHIHPRFQVVLGDLFITQSKDRELPFIIETHSEHLLLRLLRRIRETKDDELKQGEPELTPEEMVIYFTENDKDGMKIYKIRVNDTGDFIDKWPQGFFDEAMEELF